MLRAFLVIKLVDALPPRIRKRITKTVPLSGINGGIEGLIQRGGRL